MQVYAIALWSTYVSLLIIIGYLGLSHARLALISFSTLLLVPSAIRQPLYFLGLDSPHPMEHFHQYEWELICIANTALIGWTCSAMASYSVNTLPARLLARLLPSRCLPATIEERPHGLLIATIIPLTFAALGTIYLIMKSGGLADFMYDTKVEKEYAGLYIVRSAAQFSSMLAFYGILTTLRRSTSGNPHISRLTYLYMAVVALALATNYAWGNRAAIALIALGYLLGFHLFVRRLSFWQVLAASGFLIAFLQGLKILRLELLSEAVGRDLVAHENFWLNISLSLHLVEFDAFMLALRDAGHLFEVRWGQDFVNGLLSFIPRSLYPSKESFHIGGWFRRIYEPGVVNGWPVTIPGSWYVNFGPAGIFLGGWASGLLLRAYDEAFSRVRQDAWQAAIGSTLVFPLVEAGISTGFPQSYVKWVIPLLLASIWIRLNTSHRLNYLGSGLR